MKFLPFTSVTRWLLVVIGCAVLATAQPMSADENSPASPASSAAGTTNANAPATTVTLPSVAPTPTVAPAVAPTVAPAVNSTSDNAKSNTIIYPKGSGANGDRTIDGKNGNSSRSYLLVVALLLAGVGAWVLLQKKRGGVSVVARGPRKLNVEETRPLGNRQYLIVASYEGKKFLLGVTSGQIQMLSKLEEGEGKV